METIFEHSPTPDELAELIGNMPEADYRAELLHAPDGENFLFIALLYEHRRDEANAVKYRMMAPALYDEWMRNQDYAAISSDSH